MHGPTKHRPRERLQNFIVRFYETHGVRSRKKRCLSSCQRYLIYARGRLEAVQQAIRQFWQKAFADEHLKHCTALWCRQSIAQCEELASKEKLPDTLVPVAIVKKFSLAQRYWQQYIAPLLEPFSDFLSISHILQTIYRGAWR